VSRLTFGAGLFPTDPLPAMVNLAKVSESLGFTHAWVGDSHLIWREAYVTLAAAAVGTSRLVLGTGVTNVLTRDPSVVASTFSTLQEAFPRRLILGLGLGDSAVETMGKKPARLADFELAVRRMRDLLNGRDVAIDTGTIHMKHGARDRVPIYFAPADQRCSSWPGESPTASSSWSVSIRRACARRSTRSKSGSALRGERSPTSTSCSGCLALSPTPARATP